MQFKTALWLTLVIFTIHNIEEYFTMSNFFSAYGSEIPAFLARYAKPIPSDLFIVMIILITMLAAVFVYCGVKGSSNSRGMFWAMIWVTGGLLVNGLHHVVITLYFGAYTPGVFTSVVLFLPYSIYLLRKALIERQIDKHRLVWSFVVGATAIVPVILVIRGMAELFI